MTQIGVRGSKMRQKHPKTSQIPPQSIPKHIWKLFFSGHFSPHIAQKRLSPPGRLLGISLTASARENRYFGHKSGSGAQNPDFFGSSVAESPCATFRPPENLAETASTGPQIRLLGVLTQKRLSPQVPRHRPHCQGARKPVFWP